MKCRVLVIKPCLPAVINALLVLNLLLSLLPSAAAQSTYAYPFANPYVATVVGTPREYQAALPEHVTVDHRRLPVFPKRIIPALLWYSQQLDYSVIAQDKKAPLIFIISGTGASADSPKTNVLQKIFYRAGFHVVSLPSPTHPNFVAAASSTSVPGYVTRDVDDLYTVMKLVWQELRPKLQVSEFYLTGFSLGAMHAAFVSKLDDGQEVFNFKKVLMINPPVSAYESARRLDKLLLDNLPGGIDNLDDFIDEVMQHFSEAYQFTDQVEFNDDFLYAAYAKQKVSNEHLAAVIGFSFRIGAMNMVFTSDVMTNYGYIKPKNITLRPTDSVTKYYKVARYIGYDDYFDQYLYPYYRARERGLTRAHLINNLNLLAIENYLRNTPKIGLMTNADDVILTNGDITYLENVFGSRAQIYPHGGHGGNLSYKDNAADIARFFQEDESQ